MFKRLMGMEIEPLPSMTKALGSIPSAEKKLFKTVKICKHINVQQWRIFNER
jgi:hypothetical protein